jgi:hypothetical protein
MDTAFTGIVRGSHFLSFLLAIGGPEVVQCEHMFTAEVYGGILVLQLQEGQNTSGTRNANGKKSRIHVPGCRGSFLGQNNHKLIEFWRFPISEFFFNFFGFVGDADCVVPDRRVS